MTTETVVRAAAKVVAARTGYLTQTRRGRPEPIARRLNNPGLIRQWRHPSSTHSNPAFYPTNAGFVEFPSDQEGWDALETKCRIGLVYRKLSPRKFFRFWPGFNSFSDRTVAEEGRDDASVLADHPEVYTKDLLDLIFKTEGRRLDPNTEVTVACDGK